MAERSAYSILELDEDASQADVQAAYRRLAHHLHPDRGGTVADFRALNEAYKTLSDPKRRKLYDSSRDRREVIDVEDARSAGSVLRAGPPTLVRTRSFWPRSPTSLMALRLLIIANVFITAALGGIFFAYYSRPASYAFSGASWLVTIALFSMIRFTNPYR